MSLLAVDPGSRLCGAALFDLEQLTWCAVVRCRLDCDEPLLRAVDMVAQISAVVAEVNEIVVEWPQVYQRPKSKGDPNDLLPLAALAGALAARYSTADARSYRPAEWKGQVPKDVMAARIKERLDLVEELTLDGVRPASLAHNAVDAVGLGLHHLGRLKKRRA